MLAPKDPSVHKPISVRQMLEKKLRWMTLGGQYDWSRKVYPELNGGSPVVAFPSDIGRLINGLVCPPPRTSQGEIY